jgi:outer membrane protein OmpA-like peptidoglycan-associated protein
MRTKLISILASLGAFVGTAAYADHDSAPAGPDFASTKAPARHTAQDLSASDGQRALRPMAVLLFAFDNAEPSAIDRGELETARDWLAAHPTAMLVIEGHTDTVGTFAYNAGLATRRAEAVRAALITLGADPQRLVVGVFGEAQATSPNNAANRRVIVRGSTETLQQITARTLVDGMAVVWSYEPDPQVARRIKTRLDRFFSA